MSERTDRPASQQDEAIARKTITDGGVDRAITPESELHLIELLRNGDERAFAFLIEQYHRAMLHLAMIYVPKQALAEEVVQETWMGVLQGLSRFEGRSSLKTWIFRILANRAKTFALREGRSVPFSSLADAEVEAREPAVDPDRFFPPGAERAGAWISLPENWDELPEKRLLSQETYVCIESAIEALPPNQRTVITLHDVEGWTAEEICSVLDVSEVNQRVLLHRARSRVRRALERYFDEKEEA
jgi:RNA polymerase sigma-70 factor (ECF subfamily)